MRSRSKVWSRLRVYGDERVGRQCTRRRGGEFAASRKMHGLGKTNPRQNQTAEEKYEDKSTHQEWVTSVISDSYQG